MESLSPFIRSKKKVYISGMHSGQNPCSGVGIARSLKKVFPELILVGVDHWQGSSGLNDETIDEVLLLPQWSQIDEKRHTKHVQSLLDEGHLWISGLDIETHWLSAHLSPQRGLFTPHAKALELTAKPTVTAFADLGFEVSQFISVLLPDADTHAFLRQCSWQCWLKSPYHDAKRISSWATFMSARQAMSKTWKTPNLFLQQHVKGNEESIAFAAHQGKLLNAVHLQKRQITPEGKTWAGQITPLDTDFYSRLEKAISLLGWSGGGEIEYVRDPDGIKWIIECNPRFPAWIYGAAISGMNLPARMVAHALNIPFSESLSRFPLFTRVVQEIAVKEELGLPPPPDPASMEWITDGKKGKSGRRDVDLPHLDHSEEDEKTALEPLHPDLLQEVIKTAVEFVGESPKRIHLEDWSQARFQKLATRVSEARIRTPEVRIGFSVKTSPTDDHLKNAKKAGFLAECISQMEIRRALASGFRENEIILNGPGKFWPITQAPVTGLHMLICDSIEEFERVVKIPDIAAVLGFRIRLPKLTSRFGNSPSEFQNFKRILLAVRKIKGNTELGFHFHMPSWSIGIRRWMESLRSAAMWCQSIEKLSGVTVKHFDLGGGFYPSDLEELSFFKLQDTIGNILPNVKSIYMEPGRSLTQDGEVLVSRILDVRRDNQGQPTDVVVDACIAELPHAQSYTHRIFYHALIGKPCVQLRKGQTRLLGRICMEDDILSQGMDLPKTAEIGDLVIFGDAGGYERSMSYGFGRG